MERKTKLRIVICLSLFLVIAAGLLISLAFSSKIESSLGMRPQGAGTLKDYQFRVDFIDVGQGASCYITLPTGENVLIDAGTNKSEKQLIRYLTRRKVTQIDYFILTHSDNDHTGGADVVLENFEVKTIYRPFILSSNDSYDVQNDPLIVYQDILGIDAVTVVDTIDYAKCINLMYKETYTQNGKVVNSVVRVSSEEVMITASTAALRMWCPEVVDGADDISISAPNKNLTIGKPTVKCSSVNDYSPIITVDYLSSTMVITGDASTKVENDLLARLTEQQKQAFKNCDIYVAGHHGSNYSSGEKFLNLLMPKYVVVQCGESSTHPHPKFIERITKVWTDANRSGTILQTNKNGNVEFFFNSKDNVAVEQAVSYSGNGNQVVTEWWQVVVTGIAVAAVLLLIPLLPKPKKYKKRK